MDKRRKFGTPRYATRGIVDTLDPALQQELWLMIELLCRRGEKDVDYLQVFDLQPSSQEFLNQLITHRQESPPYSAIKRVRVETPITDKVFVIDDGTHCTMLFAHEY